MRPDRYSKCDALLLNFCNILLAANGDGKKALSKLTDILHSIPSRARLSTLMHVYEYIYVRVYIRMWVLRVLNVNSIKPVWHGEYRFSVFM